MNALLKESKINGSLITVNGKTVEENYANTPTKDLEVIKNYKNPIMKKAGFAVLNGNIFDAAVMKISVISDSFRKQYLLKPGRENIFDVRAIVFDGPEDYKARINNPKLNIDINCILVIRGCGPIGYPGAAEVVNMQPPDALIKKGVKEISRS